VVATRGGKEEFIVIQFPNFINFYLRSGSQSPGVIIRCFEVSHYLKTESTLYPRVIYILNIHWIWMLGGFHK
jgi:hypothetical protein